MSKGIEIETFLNTVGKVVIRELEAEFANESARCGVSVIDSRGVRYIVGGRLHKCRGSASGDGCDCKWYALRLLKGSSAGHGGSDPPRRRDGS